MFVAGERAGKGRLATTVSSLMAKVTAGIPLHDVDRAIADDEQEGFVKIHVKERTDKSQSLLRRWLAW